MREFIVSAYRGTSEGNFLEKKADIPPRYCVEEKSADSALFVENCEEFSAQHPQSYFL
jgi:hypothetical protein